MAQQHRTKRKPMAEINVVPYIDVMLVLLVIFMITAPLLTQGVKVDLPQVTSEPIEAEQLDPLVITVDKTGLFYLDVGENKEDALTNETLVARVRTVLRNKPETPVYVRGDHQVDYGSVVIAMSLLQGAGATSVGLLTEPAHK